MTPSMTDRKRRYLSGCFASLREAHEQYLRLIYEGRSRSNSCRKVSLTLTKKLK